MKKTNLFGAHTQVPHFLCPFDLKDSWIVVAYQQRAHPSQPEKLGRYKRQRANNNNNQKFPFSIEHATNMPSAKHQKQPTSIFTRFKWFVSTRSIFFFFNPPNGTLDAFFRRRFRFERLFLYWTFSLLGGDGGKNWFMALQYCQPLPTFL